MKIDIKKIGATLLKGAVKETVSYIPLVGDDLANKVDKAITTGVAGKSSNTDRLVEILGKIAPWVALLISVGII